MLYIKKEQNPIESVTLFKINMCCPPLDTL